jgi:sporulation protein YlmC with PRC-barrel domain
MGTNVSLLGFLRRVVRRHSAALSEEIMKQKATLPFLACLVAAGCSAAPYDTTATGTTTVVTRPYVATTAPIPPVAPTPTLQLRNAGSVVGYPVVDSMGQPVGTVQAVAAERLTGTVRYLVVASPSFGVGSYISVPAVNAQTTGDRVVLNAPMATWAASPRYGSQQISEMYGSF